VPDLSREFPKDVRDRVWLPVDGVTSEDEVKALVTPLLGIITKFKLGLELTSRLGAPRAVELMGEIGVPKHDLWIDTKLCDIPETVAGAARALANLGVSMFNVHAWGGRKMIEAAVANKGGAKVLVVTVLTSVKFEDLLELGIFYDPSINNDGGVVERLVQKMAITITDANADGIIGSAREAAAVKKVDAMRHRLMVTPGIRPKWAAKNDQERVVTPTEAIRNGATAMVIGRPITQPPASIGSPAEAARQIFDETDKALHC
jgi:orotidine-5'-phosphate decarboxylase